MPKIEFLETYTVEDPHGETFDKGKVYEVTDDAAEHFVKRKKAQYAASNAKVSESTFAGERPPGVEPTNVKTEPIKTGEAPQKPAAESPVINDSAPKAIDEISRMTSEDKLKAIESHDPRSTVQKAATDRLAELKAKASEAKGK